MFDGNAIWYPENYNPGISVEEWKKLLLNKDIFTYESFKLIKPLHESGESSYTRLCEKYGEKMIFYTVETGKLSRRIAEETNCPIYRHKGKTWRWAIMFVKRHGRKSENYLDVFRLREELAEALTQLEVDLPPVHGGQGLFLFDKDEKFFKPYSAENFLSEVYIGEEKYYQLVEILKRKKNIILQGAPGVGKTFAAKRLAYSIIGAKDDSKIEFVQFHQNYSYEDFVAGWRPTENGFELRHGIFYSFCRKAAENFSEDYFFIIDEINRGNLSKIFGELLMAIESDHREEKISLAYEPNENFFVPKNLYIIEMMNTADRSLAIIDYALRRRFSFFEMEPAFDSDGFKKYQADLNNKTFDKLIEQIKILNEEISADSSLGKSFCIGHSYFCNLKTCDEKILRSIVEYDILPTLREYWFDEAEKVRDWEKILRGVTED